MPERSTKTENRLQTAARRGLAVFVFGVSVLSFSAPAIACCDCGATLESIRDEVWDFPLPDQWADTINDETLIQEENVINTWATVFPVLPYMAEEFTAVAMWQVQAIGMLIDAKQQIETLRVPQEFRAQAYKDYQTSEQVCAMGTAIKSLVGSERRTEMNPQALSQRSIDRQLGNINTLGIYGHELERQDRIRNFAQRFCDTHDRNSAMEDVCTAMAWSGLSATQKGFINKDIDYFSLIDTPWTLNVDFTNDALVDEEQNIFALETNLFGSDMFPRPPAIQLQNNPNNPLQTLSKMQKNYIDIRSIVAKREVAENSFNAIVGLKSEGIRATEAGADVPMHARQSMELIMESLGVPQADVLRIIGENPSYDAQMRILTKKAFQRPEFYTRLYDTPANVKRIATAMQAIKLMQRFDMFKSFLRNEATTSVLLELAVIDLQKEIEDEIRSTDSSTIKR